jgi:glucan phosphoethanolaminetransferase (alkaline phosphatase superfamily)
VIRGIFWGLVVIWIGFWIWLGSGVAPGLFAFKVSWPIIFAILGLSMLVELIQKAARRSKYGGPHATGWMIFWGLLFIALGLTIWFSNVTLLPSFGVLWPFIFVAIGLTIIIFVIAKRTRKQPSVNVIIDKLEEGKIDVDEAVDEIRKSKGRRSVNISVNVDTGKSKKSRGKDE